MRNEIGRVFTTLIFALLLAGCATSGSEMKPEPAPMQDAAMAEGTIEATILQINDVYEIEPVQGGKWGGVARVATLRKRLLQENPNTITVIAGDFYSPSALGTAKVDGQRLDGAQMVAALNALGLDYATFGNHEFDVSEASFLQRLAESEFAYIASNVFDSTGTRLFPKSERSAIIEIPGASGRVLRLGLVGATLPSTVKPYVAYTEPVAAVIADGKEVAGKVDAVLALTHLALDQDIKVASAERVPDEPLFALVMGGHEHENIQVLRGNDLTPITKADANARTAYVHYLTFDPATDELDVRSEIRLIDDSIPEDPAVKKVVEEWVDKAFKAFEAEGLKPGEPVARVTEPLDGRESSVRNEPTTLTQIIADAMLHAAQDAGQNVDLAVYNSGSIRIDDVIQPGQVIQYDVIRILPFGGEVLVADIKGSLLDSTLTNGAGRRGSGGYVQYTGVSGQAGAWQINGVALSPSRTYRIAINDYMASGRHWEPLNFGNPSFTQIATLGDIRQAVITELEKRYGN